MWVSESFLRWVHLPSLLVGPKIKVAKGVSLLYFTAVHKRRNGVFLLLIKGFVWEERVLLYMLENEKGRLHNLEQRKVVEFWCFPVARVWRTLYL
jgi:hypothetical protein